MCGSAGDPRNAGNLSCMALGGLVGPHQGLWPYHCLAPPCASHASGPPTPVLRCAPELTLSHPGCYPPTLRSLVHPDCCPPVRAPTGPAACPPTPRPQVFREECLIYMVLEYGDIDLARLLQNHEEARRRQMQVRPHWWGISLALSLSKRVPSPCPWRGCPHCPCRHFLSFL